MSGSGEFVFNGGGYNNYNNNIILITPVKM